MNYSEISLGDIKSLWDKQMINLHNGKQDNKIINALITELVARNEISLLKFFKRDLLKQHLNKYDFKFIL